MKLIFGLLLTVAAAAFAESPNTACLKLRKLRLPQTEVLSSEYKLAGPYKTVERSPSTQSAPEQLPGFCTVKLASHPSSDSDIRIELWLPEPSAWNGKFLGTGNGGYSGTMFYDQMAEGLSRGYAVAASDTGHLGDDLNFAVGHPEKVKDWAYRATHVMAEQGHEVSRTFYGKPITHSYFRGCSTGGQQGLSEAQRFPMDFDGIIAGDPGHDRVMLNLDFVESWLATHPPEGQESLAEKLPALHRAVIAACDSDDGVKDGIISDPLSCHFDATVLRCPKDVNNAGCLSDPEIKTVTALYDGTVRDRTGKRLYPGWTRSSEGGWASYLISPSEPVRFMFWRQWIYDDPSITPEQIEPGAAWARARATYPFLDATNPDLSRFGERGGKLLIYHGWADAVVPSENSIEYYNSVTAKMGEVVTGFVRLFMVPGMNHCGGGEGASTFDALGALDSWSVDGKAPERILATHFEDGNRKFTRPLCSYPFIATWDGVHGSSDAESFVCITPKNGH